MENKIKILITSTSFQDVKGKHHEKIRSYNFEIDFLRGPLPESSLINIIHDYDGIICGDDEITSKVIKNGKVVSIDLKSMEEIKNTIQIKGDFTDPSIQKKIKDYLNKDLDVVMSDMAVNTTGIKNLDAIQTGELCKEAMIFSKDVISQNGFFISKIFMGSTFNEIVALGKKIFKEVKVFKPQSSRKDSKESFIICKKIR